MKLQATVTKVQIKWFVVAGGVKIPHNATMCGTWGWDAECSCGWTSKTGGATRNSVVEVVEDHKVLDHNYIWVRSAS